MVLDDGDGLIARYQKKTSDFGSFLDKTADIIRFGILFPLLGYLAFNRSNNYSLLVISSLTPFMLMVQGYTKWIDEAQKLKLLNKKSNNPNEKSNGKRMTLGILNALLWPFHECDLTLWIITLLLLNRLHLLVWMLFISQTVMAIVSVVTRMFDAYKRDKIRNVE